MLNTQTCGQLLQIIAFMGVQMRKVVPVKPRQDSVYCKLKLNDCRLKTKSRASENLQIAANSTVIEGRSSFRFRPNIITEFRFVKTKIQ